VEGGHQQPPHPHVLVLVHQQHRVLAHDRTEDRVALARVVDGGRAAEHGLDLLGLGEHHQPPVPRRDVQREHVAVAALHQSHQLRPEHAEQEALRQQRQRCGRRQRGVDGLGQGGCGERHGRTPFRVAAVIQAFYTLVYIRCPDCTSTLAWWGIGNNF
jgi:hypothetical protein